MKKQREVFLIDKENYSGFITAIHVDGANVYQTPTASPYIGRWRTF